MGRELAERSPAAARGLRRGRPAALGWSVSRRGLGRARGAPDDTRQTQPCLLATLAAWRRSARIGPRPAELATRHSWPATRSASTPRSLPRACSSSRPTPCASWRDVASSWPQRRGRRHGGGASASTAMPSQIGGRRPWPRPTELVVANDNAPGPGRHLRTPGGAARTPRRRCRRPAPAASSACRCRVRSTRRSWPGSPTRWPTAFEDGGRGATPRIAGREQRHRRAAHRRRAASAPCSPSRCARRSSGSRCVRRMVDDGVDTLHRVRRRVPRLPAW